MDTGFMNLRWNNYKSIFFETIRTLREKSKYTDATLVVDGHFYHVHKLVMSTCSEYFSNIFENISSKEPVIVLKDVSKDEIEGLLSYMYLGEVNVHSNNIESFLKTAKSLRIKGLAVSDDQSSNSSKSQNTNLDTPSSLKKRSLENTSSSTSAPPVKSLKKSNASSIAIKVEMSSPEMSKQDKTPMVKIGFDKEREQRIRNKINYDEDPGSDNDCESVYEPNSPMADDDESDCDGPTQETAGHSAPTHDTEAHGTTPQDAADHGAPSHDAAGHSAPTLDTKAHGATTHDAAGHGGEDNAKPSTSGSAQQQSPNDVIELQLNPDHMQPEVTVMPDEDFFDIIVENDNVYKYKKIEGGSKRGRMCIIEECNGEQRALAMQWKKNFERFPVYTCRYKSNPKIKCPGRYCPRSDNLPSASNRFKVRTKSRRKEHTCLPNKDEVTCRIIRRECKKKALANPELKAYSIAKEVIQDNYGDINLENTMAQIPSIHSLAEIGRYARKVNTKQDTFNLDKDLA